MTSSDATFIPVTTPSRPRRIGIVLARNIPGKAISALEFLLLHLNTVQSYFEYQLPPPPEGNSLLERVSTAECLDVGTARELLRAFRQEAQSFHADMISRFKRKEEPPEVYIVISCIKLSNSYYGIIEEGSELMALGDWDIVMAPPSLLECILTLVVTSSVHLATHSVRGHSHLGTKGCLFDFNVELKRTRYKVLQNFICAECCSQFDGNGDEELLSAIRAMTSRTWLGETSDAGSPAGIVKSLGYDLFQRTGFTPSLRQRFMMTLESEGFKELIKGVTALLLAGLVGFISVKVASKDKPTEPLKIEIIPQKKTGG